MYDCTGGPPLFGVRRSAATAGQPAAEIRGECAHSADSYLGRIERAQFRTHRIREVPERRWGAASGERGTRPVRIYSVGRFDIVP